MKLEVVVSRGWGETVSAIRLESPTSAMALMVLACTSHAYVDGPAWKAVFLACWELY